MGPLAAWVAVHTVRLATTAANTAATLMASLLGAVAPSSGTGLFDGSPRPPAGYGCSHGGGAFRGVDNSYVARVLRLTLLAPDLIEAILEGTEPDGLSLEKLYRLPDDWEEQRQTLGFCSW
jgi:hypothetical protein